MRNYSENIARVFEIVNYFILIPLLCFGIWWLPSIIYLIVIVIVSLFSERFTNFGITYLLILLGVIGIIIFNIQLLLGYYRHSRSKLNKKKVDKLWIKTICFNAIFFFPSFYHHLQCLVTEECFVQPFSRLNYILNISNVFPIVFLILTCWWAMAIILSFIAALSIEDDKTQ